MSCENFRADYESRADEQVVVMFIRWPRSAGDTVSFGASETEERFQFCRGRASGTTRCEPREPEQGSVTVVGASPESGTLEFDVSSTNGSLSGELEFTLCPMNG